MPDIKLFSMCHACGRKHLFVRRAMIKLPIINTTAKSRDYLCTKHINLLRNNISTSL